MKATGIVRRIDDLGRVVIPKEIRRTQLIRVGDPLEIFVSGAGEVIFKKYSPIGELSDVAARYVEAISKTAGAAVAVADRDHVVAAAGAARETAEKPLTPAYAHAVERRRLFTAADRETALPLCEGSQTAVCAMMPILSSGDLVGSVALTGDPGRAGGTPDESAVTLVKVAAAFLGRQLEE